MSLVRRIVEWWQRTCWGWLVIIAPVICYLALPMTLDLVGLSADSGRYFREFDPYTSFRTGIELDLKSMAGRMEYALVAAIYFLVAAFSIIWALPKIIARWRNPFGGLFGLVIAGGMTAFLYLMYLQSDYNIRVAFADEILQTGENATILQKITVNFAPFGLSIFSGDMMRSELLQHMHSVVYLIGGAAPWVLVVFMACLASFEPRMLGKESHRSLRQRMAFLQIAVVLAAANIVLSVAYLGVMTHWPLQLLNDDLSGIFLSASARHAAVWGALGTLMLASTLAPAYVALNRQFDRVAEHELQKEDDDGYVSYEERILWRRKHGLLLSAQQAVTAGLAVIAPLVTSPSLEATSGKDTAPVRYERPANLR